MNNTDKNKNGSADHHSGNEENYTPETIIIINCVLNAPLMLISILGNALVLAAIIRTPSIRSTSMIMLCSLAVSDFLVGLIAQPLYIALQLTKTDRLVHHAAFTIGFSLCGVSLLTITTITVDRFLALHYHMRYAALVTEFRIKCILATIWLSSFGLSSSQLWNKPVLPTIAAFVTITCLIISTFSYIRIYLIVRRHQLQIHAQQQAVQSSNAENNLDMVRLKRSAMNTFVFYIALIICYFPFYVLLTLYGISDKVWQKEGYFVLTAVFMNSSLNPFLYCWRLRELRTAVVKTARQILCKQTEGN
ncbi:histamine H2 receptor-like [Oculina patagonica]